MDMNSGSNRIFIGLGSNLGDRAGTIQAARAALIAHGWEETAFSGLYESPPWGKTDQPAFLNAVAEGKWQGNPMEFLQLIMEVEAGLGRVRLETWGPRRIDIDILSFGEVVLETQRLSLPHPFLHQRAFVLLPWAAIAPRFMVPKYNRGVLDLLNALPDEDREGVKPYLPPQNQEH